MDLKVVDEIIEMMKIEFGDVTVNWGRRHKFVGMDIEFMKQSRSKPIHYYLRMKKNDGAKKSQT